MKRSFQVPIYGKNWETPQGVDFELLAADVRKAVDILARADTAAQKDMRGLRILPGSWRINAKASGYSPP